MRAYRIGPARDHLGALLALVDRLVEQRLAAKASARAAPPGSAERHTHEAMSAAMKLVVNSAYGYLAAGGGLTRFADVHAANEVTRRGREMLDLMCRELAARGVTLLEADTDGVYFAVPDGVDRGRRAARGRRGRRAAAAAACSSSSRAATRAMLSHEPKNYALLGYDGALAPARRGVPLEPRRAVRRGVPAARDRPAARRRRRRRARRVRRDVLARCAGASCRPTTCRRACGSPRRRRSTSRPASSRRELPYEAMLASGRTTWSVGDRVRVYRTRSGGGRHRGVRRRDGRRPNARTARLRRRALRARAARDLRRAAGARVHARGLRRRVRRPGSAVAVHAALATIRTVLSSLPEPGVTALGQT